MGCSSPQIFTRLTENWVVNHWQTLRTQLAVQNPAIPVDIQLAVSLLKDYNRINRMVF